MNHNCSYLGLSSPRSQGQLNANQDSPFQLRGELYDIGCFTYMIACRILFALIESQHKS